MKIERTRNARRNMIFGTVLKIYQLAMPFMMRTIMIYFMGVQYLGLNSLFTSVLQVLNLAELGVGSAMIYSMYRPIAEDDEKRICALMGLYRLYYRVIGAVVLVLGLLLVPFIPKLIHGEVPADINIYILYILNLLASVLSYWLFAYKNSIFEAHQRVDVVSKVTLFTDTIKYLVQILAMIYFHNYYFYVIGILFSQVLNNLAVAFAAEKIYPDYRPVGQLDRDEIRSINQRIKDLFTAKLGSVVVNSADTIVISAFLGLTVLAVYQNYFYIFTAVTGLINIVFNSVSAGIGNSIIVESENKIFEDFRTFNWMIAWITGFCCACFLCLYQPFMELWVGKDLMVEFPVVICLVIYFFVYQINRLLNVYKDAAGMWHEDRLRPLVTSCVNLGLNLLLVNYIGLYGIVLSTVLSMVFVGMPWIIHNLFSVVFHRNRRAVYIKILSLDSAVTLLVCALTYFLCCRITAQMSSLIAVILIRLIVCIVLSNALFLLFYSRLPESKNALRILKRMLGKS